MSITEYKEKSWVWSPSLIVYDVGMCTKEEHDPAKAILYCRPRNMPANMRTIVCGQIAGLNHFCKLAFSDPVLVKTKNAYFAIKNYGRFVLMMTGMSKVWAESHLMITSKLLDSAVGGICVLWKETRHDYSAFASILSSILDAIVFHALHDIHFEDGIFASSSVSTSLSSGLSPSSDLLEDLDSEKSIQEEENGFSFGILRKKIDAKTLKNQNRPDLLTATSLEESDELSEHAIMTTLNREFNAVPSVPLPKSGGYAFLKAQQLFEVCQQHSGVLAGSIFFQNRVLGTQIEPELELVISSLNDNDNETNEILQKKNSSFELPKDVALYIFNLKEEKLSSLKKSIPKISMKRRGRKGLHSEVHSKDLSSLRSTLQNQSLHSYPSFIPPLTETAFNTECENMADFPLKKTIDSALLCAKLSHNGDLLSDVRPSRSLPGSPRKIRVSTMLPDVGRDSPDLRYKILTTKRHKPGMSNTNTPKKFNASLFNNIGKIGGQNNCNNIHRGINLSAPLLKRKDYVGKNDQIRSNNILDKNFQLNKENINSCGQNQLIEHSVNEELNIKNTKNKLNLHFAPEKINRPHNDYDAEAKISREINGNIGKDQKENRSKKTLIEIIDDDDGSKSEESEISVLELSSFLESKENGNKMFAEATRPDSPKSDSSEVIEEYYANHYSAADIEQLESFSVRENAHENQWTKVTLYVQKTSKMSFFLFLEKKASDNESLIYDLYQFASSSLSDIEMSLEKTLELSEERESETYLRKSNSILTSSDLCSLSLPLVIETHRDFIANHNLTELTLRKEEKVVWGHKTCETETFYQSCGTSRPGLPIPSDDMSRIPHRARRRLERDYGITIL